MEKRFGKKLVLKRETVRMLTDREAAAVYGGFPCTSGYCIPTSPCCDGYTTADVCGTTVRTSNGCTSVGSCSDTNGGS